MTLIKHALARLVLASLAVVVPVTAVQAADVDWQGWSFDWTTNNNSSGLVLTDVHYNQKKILGKISLPIMRVKYENDLCGPYSDILTTAVLEPAITGAPDDACNNLDVCTRTFTRNGEQMMEVGSNWQIGEYQIYQTYYFSENGYFDSRIYSRGLQCLEDHDHHPHWMMDFDIEGPENDQILADGEVQATEFNDLKSNTSEWTIKDKQTGYEVRIIPSAEDGEPDAWSAWDFAGRDFVERETGKWRQGSRTDIGDLFMEGADIDGQDLVVWYVAHLSHSADEGSDVWHASGPRIQIATVTPPSDVPVESEPEILPDPDNLLANGSFEQGKAGWTDCAAEEYTNPVSVPVEDGDSALRISDGGCLYQEVPTRPGDELTLSCHASRVGTNWTIQELSFVDSDYNVLANNTLQIINGSEFSLNHKAATAPANTAYATVLLYSEDDSVFDDCILQAGNSTPQIPSNSATLLTNGSFEQDLANWQACASSSLLQLSSDASEGAKALALSNGGCLYQEFPVQPGNAYTLSCDAKRQNTNYTSLRIAMLNNAYTSLAADEQSIINANYQQSTAIATAPANSTIGVVAIYSEGQGNFDNCEVKAN